MIQLGADVGLAMGKSIGSGASIVVEQIIIQCDSPMTLESFRTMLTEAIEEEAEVAA